MVLAESSAVFACARSSSSFATRVTIGVSVSAILSVFIFVGIWPTSLEIAGFKSHYHGGFRTRQYPPGRLGRACVPFSPGVSGGDPLAGGRLRRHDRPAPVAPPATVRGRAAGRARGRRPPRVG